MIKVNDEGEYSLNGCYLQEHFAAVDAHRIHGAEGHESDGDRRRRVHCVIVTEHTTVNVLNTKTQVLSSQVILCQMNFQVKTRFVRTSHG